MSHSTRPVIGVCAVRERARWAFWDQEAHLVADSYVAPLQRAGGLAVLLAVDTRAPLELLDRVDGLMLIGGADLDPASYGAAQQPGTESTYPDRDAFEIALSLGALAREMPVLGICRGMQILNVALGGTLVQDLVAPDGTHPHRKFKGDLRRERAHRRAGARIARRARRRRARARRPLPPPPSRAGAG